jgi:hypothetical protein
MTICATYKIARRKQRMTENNANADLLAELNGSGATQLPTPDAAELEKANAAVAADPLKVLPAEAKSAVARTQAAAQAKGPVKGYAVTVEGDYLTPSAEVPSKKVKKPYKITVNLTSLEGALSVIKNKLLDKMLKLKYPGYVTYSTHEITDVKTLSSDTPPVDNVAFMDRPKLLSFIEFRRVPVDVKAYGDDLKNLRAAVVDFILNPKDFEKREEKRLKDLAETRELEKLNPEVASA